MTQIILLAAILAVSIVAPVVVVLCLRAQQRAETERFIARMEEALGSSVKLLEVRNYYDQMAGEFKKMLDEAFREGNRFRQDHVRHLMERLEQLKARTLDKTVRILEQPAGQQGQGRPPFRRRHHRGGRRHHGQGDNPPPGYEPPRKPEGGPSQGPRPNPPSTPQPPRPPAQQ